MYFSQSKQVVDVVTTNVNIVWTGWKWLAKAVHKFVPDEYVGPRTVCTS